MASRLHAHIGTFRQLEILLALHQGGSVKAASEKLFLTQPTVSMQLKKLAEAIGLPLYEQVGKQLKFTDAGLATVATAKQILQSCEELDMHLSNLRGLKSGTLRLSSVTTAKYFIPHLLGPFCERYPGIDIQFTVANRQQVIERLEQGLDDFYVFSHLPEGLDLEVIEFMSNDLVAIAPASHPFSQKDTVSLEEFCQEDFLIRESGSGTRYATEAFFKNQTVTPNIKMTIASNEAIIHSVLSRLGVSILSSHTLAFGEIHDVNVINVESLPIRSKWSFSWTKRKTLSPIASVFLTYVETEGREIMQNAIRI
ncbi:LysR family transcriptional regulator [Pseudoalteromonas luteoviolacea]|uniref:Transcriptional regulator n=2 Tax=Pseudoalteromonas luteoviolacea TaxID=43657 RepID=A0A162ALS8_9GAMM|nr:LysR family transcriptional regulator [Pseudoalteromonas luteoviolacea]KID55107.1 LysR family transcriptional regulator [Pseudoalteromonas luteoviolacea]KZN52132.1 transcriptional regulator [Pseudoalteromonas luteoviolacea H33]KZN78848.1 transcriptional regulator [Pseudoalteromonas luteoviolacea H33-S]MBQ4876210.1 LysR family transcriptional regulator [Pseudoalteromonas luteoviolacea]MBQ4906244.1 LysR family transcriptional regulator [Pseudoalteromonas luteoviolacea]